MISHAFPEGSVNVIRDRSLTSQEQADKLNALFDAAYGAPIARYMRAKLGRVGGVVGDLLSAAGIKGRPEIRVATDEESKVLAAKLDAIIADGSFNKVLERTHAVYNNPEE